MIKIFFACTRRPDITHARYTELVLEGHAPLAIAHHPTMRRYVINITEGEADIDALPALYFDDLDDYTNRLYDSAEGEAAIRRDIEQFLARADAYTTTERIHKDESPASAISERTPGVKWICPIKRRPSMAQAEFAEYWQGAHVPLVLKHQPGLTRYVTNLVDARLSDTGEDWDGFAEFHFANEDAASRPFDSAVGERRVTESLARFVERRLIYPVEEYVQK